MKTLIIDFIIGNLKSLGLALVFLLLALVFLPDSWIFFIIKVIKPRLIDKIKEPFRKMINTLTNLYINNKLIDINTQNPEFIERTQFYIHENSKREKNIYVLDLCKDMIATLNYAVPNAIGQNDFSIFEQAMEYIYHYSRIAEYLEQDKNFIHNFLGKINMLKEAYETGNNSSINSDVTEFRMKQDINIALNYLAEERIKLSHLLEENKNKLVNRIRECINEL